MMWIFCGFCEYQKEDGLSCVSDAATECPECSRDIDSEGITTSPLPHVSADKMQELERAEEILTGAQEDNERGELNEG